MIGAKESGHDRVTDIVIGMSDGIIIPFALSTALTVVTNSSATIILVGTVAIIIGAIAMGLGSYFAAKESEHEELPVEQEKEALHKVFTKIGLREDTQASIVEGMQDEQKQWDAYKAQHNIDTPLPTHFSRSAINIALSYIAGGCIPLIAYFLFADPAKALKISCAITIICLLCFGFFKAKATGRNSFTGAMRSAILGIAAAGAAWFMAGIFA